MVVYLRNFWREEEAQDLFEYSILIAFMALACMAIFGTGRPILNSVWQAGNNQLANALAYSRGS